MKQLKQWRTQGNAPDVTPETFAQATQALAQIPVPAPAGADKGKDKGKGKPNAAPAGNTTNDAGQESQNGMVLASGNTGGPTLSTGVTTGLLAAAVLGVGLLGMHLRGRRRAPSTRLS